MVLLVITVTTYLQHLHRNCSKLLIVKIFVSPLAAILKSSDIQIFAFNSFFFFEMLKFTPYFPCIWHYNPSCMKHQPHPYSLPQHKAYILLNVICTKNMTQVKKKVCRKVLSSTVQILLGIFFYTH